MKNHREKLKINFCFLVVVFIFSFFVFHFNEARAAVLYLDPAGGDYGAGDNFVINVRLNNEDECVNVADVRIKFPTDLLWAKDFGKGGSILTLWVGEPVLDNNEGIVSFTGGLPASYCGRVKGDPGLSNILGKIVFDVLPEVKNNSEIKTANIEILPDSQVILGDGLGSPANTKVNGAVFRIAPSGAERKNEWLNQLAADKTPPEPFTAILQRDDKLFDGKYYLVFLAVDKQSGLDHFEVFEKGSWRRAESPYVLLDQSPPDEIRVRAIDNAGNERLGEYISGNVTLSTLLEKKRNWDTWLLLVIVFLGLTFFTITIVRQRRNTPDGKI